MRWPPPGRGGSRSSRAERPAAHFAAERQRLPLLTVCPQRAVVWRTTRPPPISSSRVPPGHEPLTITVAGARWGAQAAPVRNPVAVPDALKHGLFSIQDARSAGLTPDQLRGQ